MAGEHLNRGSVCRRRQRRGGEAQALAVGHVGAVLLDAVRLGRRLTLGAHRSRVLEASHELALAALHRLAIHGSARLGHAQPKALLHLSDARGLGVPKL